MNHSYFFNFMFLFISLSACALAFYRARWEHEHEMADGSERARSLLLALAVLLALGIRLYRFGSVPGGFNQDGAMAAMDAKALAEYGTDRLGMRYPVHLTAWGFGQMSAMLSYLMAICIRLFGFTRIALRLPQLLASLAGLAFMYLFVKDCLGRRAALAALLFAAIDPWHIMQSRWALDCNLFPHFLMGGLFFLNRGIKSRAALIASMLMFALSMYCYGVALYTVPLFLLAAALWLMCSRRLSARQVLLALGVYLLVSWPFFAVMLINYLGLDTVETPLFTLPYFPGSIRSEDILFFSRQPLRQLLSNLVSLVRVVFLQEKDLPWNDIAGFGALYLFSLPFTLAGLCHALRKRKNTGVALMLLLFCVGLFSGLVTNSANINRVNVVCYPMLILTGVGIYRAARPLPVKCAVAAIYSAAFIMFSCVYFTTFADSIRYQFLDDFGEALVSLKASDAERLYITCDSQYSGSTATSEILTQFYLELDARYCQGETAEGETPYKEKYRVADIGSLDIDPWENAAYLVTESDLQFFDTSLYTTARFGRFYTVICN